MSSQQACPIWESPPRASNIDECGQLCDSPRAGGRFVLMQSGAACLHRLSDRQKANLSYWIYRHNLECRKFDEGSSGEKPIVVDQDWVEGHRDRIPTASDRMLTWLRELIRCDDAGEATTADLQQAAGGCRHAQDLNELARHSMQQGWTGNLDPNWPAEGSDFINLAGRIHVDEQLRDLGSGRNGFVAMWFDDYMKKVYDDAIGPAIEDAGYEPVLIDRREFLGDIPDEILAQIRQSRFVVADFTCCKQCTVCETCKKKRRKIGAPGGVYYETGFARGLDIPVIHTVREDCMDDVHFDTSSINHITWENPKDLRAKLHRRIGATLGRGPVEPPTEGRGGVR